MLLRHLDRNMESSINLFISFYSIWMSCNTRSCIATTKCPYFKSLEAQDVLASPSGTLQILSTYTPHYPQQDKTRQDNGRPVPYSHSILHGNFQTQTPRPNRYNTLNSTPAAPFDQRVQPNKVQPNKASKQTDRLPPSKLRSKPRRNSFRRQQR